MPRKRLSRFTRASSPSITWREGGKGGREGDWKREKKREGEKKGKETEREHFVARGKARDLASHPDSIGAKLQHGE